MPVKQMDALTRRAAHAMLCMQRYCWEQGVAMQAFYEWQDWNTLVPLAAEAAYRRLPDGRPAIMGAPNAATDPCGCGEALAAAAAHTGDPQLQDAADGLLDWTLHHAPRSPQGLWYHLTDGCEFWADSAYMLPPYLAAAGHPEEAVRAMDGYWDVLYDEKTSLMHHKWDDRRQMLSRASLWGTGSGWTLAGLARLIALLPPEYGSDARRMEEKARALLDGVLCRGNADGSFPDILDDPASFAERNLAQMAAYTIFRGVADGWLERTYLSQANRLRAAARQGVDAQGFVTPVCGAPDFDRPGRSVEAQAFFLLMEHAALACQAG